MLEALVEELVACERELGAMDAQNMFFEQCAGVDFLAVPLFFDKDDRTKVVL